MATILQLVKLKERPIWSLPNLKKRNKLIRIADKSEGGWKTVEEYLSDAMTSDSEDEKRIRAADNRAVRLYGGMNIFRISVFNSNCN
jgi:hypothetical protein